MNFQEFLRFEPKRTTFALIGNPLKHSVSVELHSIVYACENIDAEYIAVELAENELEAFVHMAKEKLYGFNVTIPYKEKIIPYMDFLDESAKFVGSVNTVKITDGKLTGYNTDICGVRETFRQKEIVLKNKKAALLGSGGSAKMIACVLSESCKEVRVIGRNREKVAAFVESLPALNKEKLNAFNYESFDIKDTEILVNATPVGMTGFGATSPISLKPARNLQFIFDIVYNPLQTPLLKQASGKHIKYDNGLLMLITQGVVADEIWLNRKIASSTVKKVRSRLAGNVAVNRLHVVHKRENILLSGFMGCGKTTVGKVLAKRLGFEFYDIDRVIEVETNMTISEIFSKYGESHFRKIESEQLKKAAERNGLVIASGGGALVDRKNYEIAAKNCLVIYLKSDFEFLFQNICKSKSRPLLLTENPRETALVLYEKRIPMYEENKDLAVKANLEVNRVVRNIIYSI